MSDDNYFNSSREDFTSYSKDTSGEGIDTADTGRKDDNDEIYLDEIAAGKLATYDACVYAVQNLFDNLKDFNSAKAAGIDINPAIIKNAFDPKKGPKVEEHINSGQLQITKETRTVIWIRSLLLQSQIYARDDFIELLAEESEKRKMDPDYRL